MIHSVPPTGSSPSLPAAMRRAVAPFILFAATLALLMALSGTFLLPRLARIEVSGSLRTPAELREYRSALERELAGMEERRSRSLLAVQDPAYRALRSLQWGGQTPAPRLLDRLREIAAGVTTQPDAVHISGISFGSTGSIVVTGGVRFVGPRCMTLLAAFVGALGDAPGFRIASMPRFVREDDPRIGPSCPFSITLERR